MSSENKIICIQVQFKVASGSYAVGNSAVANFGVGDYVIVEADRGEDIGVIISCQLRRVAADQLNSEDSKPFRQIYRFATSAERSLLQQKELDEQQAVQVGLYLFIYSSWGHTLTARRLCVLRSVRVC